MTISPALQRLYASNPNGDTLQTTLELSHSAFSQTHYLTAWPERFEADVGITGGNAMVWFEPFPFQVVLPSVQSGGHQQMRIALSNVGRVLLDELDAATAAPAEAIICRYRSYVNKTGLPSPDPALEFQIEATEESVGQISGIAARSDIVNLEFPRLRYQLAQFPGLRR